LAQTQTRSPSTIPSLPWARTDFFAFALIGASTIILIWRFWQPGIPNRGDMLMTIYRIYELAEAWKYGILYPRLGPDLNFTYGAPLFQYYPPLVSYLGLPLHGLRFPFIMAGKAVLTLLLPLAGAGMYLYARSLFANRPAAVLSALIYLSSPYLLTDIYERGAAAEGLALALLPWLLWSVRQLLYTGRRTHFWLSAGLVAGVTLAHNITAFFVLPAVAGYIALLALRDRQLRPLLWVGLAFVVGFGLSMFYWLPALAELRYSHTKIYMLSGTTDATKNLVAWRELVQPDFFFQYQGPLRFRYSLQQTLLLALALLTLPLRPPRLRYELALFVLLWAFCLLLQLQVTLPFWRDVPMVSFIQLPWRLFGLATICVAVLSGSLLACSRGTDAIRWPLALALCGISFFLNMQHLKPELLPLWYEIDEDGISQLDLFRRGAEGYPLFSDYSPVSMQLTSGALAMPRRADIPPLPPLTVAPNLVVLAENPVEARLNVQATTPFTLRFQRIFFPGWQIFVDDRPVATQASGAFGLVTAEMPAGTYVATIKFGQTPVRRIADWLSLVCLAAGVAALIQLPRRRATWLARLVAVLLIAATALYLQARAKPAHQPSAYAANFQDELHLLGYELNDSVWQPGELVTLRLYWLAQKTPSADYKIFLHVATQDDTGKVAQADSAPMAGFSPMTRWEAGEVVVDEHQIQLDAGVPPGHYRLLLGLYQQETMQNLLVRDAPIVLPGDRVVLAEVEIQHE
jgi:hypothetical protein